VSTLEEIEFMNIQSAYFDRPNHEDRNIYQFSTEDLLTVVIGAKCRDGIVLIADKKLTNVIGGKDDEGIKIIGDLSHILIEYTGAVNMFDIFRKYVVGDVINTRDKHERYKYDNSIIRTSTALTRHFNTSIGKQNSAFELLVVKHIPNNSE
jgi:20S proteasome alpha/beta subunit